MKNSTKFWYFILLIFSIILSVNYWEVILHSLFLFIVIISCFYSFISFWIIVESFKHNIIYIKDDEDLKEDVFYEYFIKYNPLYYVFYICLSKFNNYLNKL